MIKFESEKHLELFIYGHFDKSGECLIDDSHYDACISQFDTCGYGIPDLVFFNDYGENRPFDVPRYQVHVVELKNEQIKVKDLSQISRYKTCFDLMFDEDAEVSCSLVVPQGVRMNDDACWLINSLNDISVFEFELSPHEGIVFKSLYGWSKSEFDKDFSKEKLLEMVSLGKDF